MSYKTVYLTGAPAAGKTSACRALQDSISPLHIWEYGARLTEYLAARRGKAICQSELREHSSAVVSPDDVRAVDHALAGFVAEHRSSSHIIVDSHPVTKEAYGFRITPFSIRQIQELQPDEIWLLHAPPAETVARIAAAAEGRPSISEEQAATHAMLQASVATTYSIITGAPAYIFESDRSLSDLVARMAARLSK